MSAGSAPAASNRARGLTAELVFTRRSLLHSLRDGESLLMAILLPVLLMLLFTFVFGGAIDPSGGYRGYVVPGIILTCAGFGAASTAVYVAGDLEAGIIDRFRSMPLRDGAVLTGDVLASLVRNLLATAVVIAVAVLIGFRPSASVTGWLGVAGLLAGCILAITYLFAAIGLAAGSVSAANAYGFGILFLPYLSSAYVPVATMPGWLQGFAAHQPVTPVIESVRAWLAGADPGAELGRAAAWCLVLLVAGVTWGAWLYRRRAARR